MPIAPFEAIVLKKVGESGNDGTTMALPIMTKEHYLFTWAAKTLVLH